VRCTDDFLDWISGLDRSLAIRIDKRLQNISAGNYGLHKRFDGLLEIKWKRGTMGSFRLYCTEYEGLILLLGGHKDSQSKDIEKAKSILKEVKDGKIRIKEYE